MEIGGFITEGAEIVNHDNTLSGNGTVDSPLGVSETVLWEGNNVKPSSTAIVTSEDMTKFDSIKFYWSTSNWLGEIIDEVQITSATTGIQLIHCTGSANLWLQAIGLTISSDHKSITLSWGKNMNFGSVTSTSWSNPVITTGAGDSFDLSKIVGIKRKAQ